MIFDTYITVDWSGGNQKSVAPCADAIWASLSREGHQNPPLYFRNRQLVEAWLTETLSEETKHHRRVFVGFDFAFGFPRGFVPAVTGSEDPLSMWSWLNEHIIDSPTANNRFEIAGLLNAKFDGVGPFWGNASAQDVEGLPRKGRDRTHATLSEHREVERKTKGAFPVWQLAGAGAVGSQTLMGLPVLERLRRRFEGQVAVWPFQPLDTPIAFVEIWPSLYDADLKARNDNTMIKDALQVDVLTRKIATMQAIERDALLSVPPTPEGWIFGVAP